MRNKLFFKKYSLFALLFTLITVFWGAWVRLSLSGDGCGDSWPLCNEKILPESTKALTEWIHRGSSGLSLIVILILFISALRFYPKQHMIRKLSAASFVLILIEALIGAFLVLSGLVGLNTTEIRIVVLACHLINSLLLVGALSLCWKVSLWDHFIFKKPHIYFIAAFPLLALTGNIASLAGQLFPSQSLSQALALDLLPSAHISLKLRPFHPLLAVLFLIALGLMSFSFKHLKILALASLAAALFGLATLVSLSPLWMKMGHLILAYALWTLFVCFSVKTELKTKAHPL